MVLRKWRMEVLGSEVVDIWKGIRCGRGAASWLVSKQRGWMYCRDGR